MPRYLANFYKITCQLWKFVAHKISQVIFAYLLWKFHGNRLTEWRAIANMAESIIVRGMHWMLQIFARFLLMYRCTCSLPWLSLMIHKYKFLYFKYCVLSLVQEITGKATLNIFLVSWFKKKVLFSYGSK